MIALTTEFLKTDTQTAFNVLLSASLNCHVDFRCTFNSGSPFPVLRCILPVPRSPFSFSCFLFPVFCFLFPVSCFLFRVLCFVFCVLCFVFCFFVFCVLCFLFCVLCFVFCVFVFCVLCFEFFLSSFLSCYLFPVPCFLSPVPRSWYNITR